MQTSSCLFLFLFLVLSPLTSGLSHSKVSYIVHRQLLNLRENSDLPDNFEFQVNLSISFASPRLKRAYIGLHAWKKAVYSDTLNTTSNWDGPDVCSYNGVFCAPALDDPKINVVAGVDLNQADIAGYLPVELGLLTDLALFHVNSNRFCGVIPKSFSKLKLLHELDVSNNRLVGPFPEVVLDIPTLKYLDIRYNDFEGSLPPELFLKDMDAMFLNNNRFTSTIPETMGNSTVSVVVLANNNLSGCIPHSVGNMKKTLNEMILANNRLEGCFPVELGYLGSVTVLDASSNMFSGTMPKSLAGLNSAQEINVSNNTLTGYVPEEMCMLPNLNNFTFSYNYFNGEGKGCMPGLRKDVVFDDRTVTNVEVVEGNQLLVRSRASHLLLSYSAAESTS
ncbi:hypothetical protein QQ045_023526 [Rhodiola kirilowii]